MLKRFSPHSSASSKRGVTSLVEVMMVLAATGLIAGFILKAGDLGMRDCTVATKTQMKEIENAVTRFAIKNERLPLPASRVAGVESPNYGREAATPAQIAANDPIGLAAIAALDKDTATNTVIYGALPFQALGIGSSYAGDCWGNKLDYAVTIALTNSTNYLKSGAAYVEGNIAVKNSLTNIVPVSNVIAYAVISHGADGTGAVKLNYTGSDKKWCQNPSFSAESENCDVTNNVIMDARINDGKDASTNKFDDVILFRGRNMISLDGKANTPAGIAPLGPVSTNSPTQDLCVRGTVSMDSGRFACGGTRTWVCLGEGLGKPDNGSVTTLCPINGAKNPAVTSTTPPAINDPGLCLTGTPSADTGVTACNIARTWSCLGINGGTNDTSGSATTACASPTGTWTLHTTPCNGNPGTETDYYTCDGGNGTCSGAQPSGGTGNCCANGYAYSDNCGPPSSPGPAPSPTPDPTPPAATPTDGGWGGWSGWGDCSGACGGGTGTQTRTRSCNNPAPSGGGNYCAGSDSESQSCTNSTACPATCTATFETGTTPCGAGYTGTIDWRRDFTCPAASWGAWTPVANTCEWIVTPTPTPDPVVNGKCSTNHNLSWGCDYGTPQDQDSGNCGAGKTANTWRCEGSGPGHTDDNCTRTVMCGVQVSCGHSKYSDWYPCYNGLSSGGESSCDWQWFNTAWTCTGYDGTAISCKDSVTNCFLPETLITMADGSTKPVKELKIGDLVRGHTSTNKVLRLPNFDTDQRIYGFNGGKAFVTGGHPFYTKSGWKAVDPKLTPTEGHNVKTTKLKVGDELLLDTGEKFVIESIDGEDSGEHNVFNPGVSGDHTYYANGLLVHNKCMMDN